MSVAQATAVLVRVALSELQAVSSAFQPAQRVWKSRICGHVRKELVDARLFQARRPQQGICVLQLGLCRSQWNGCVKVPQKLLVLESFAAILIVFCKLLADRIGTATSRM